MGKDAGVGGGAPSLDDLFHAGHDVEDAELAGKLIGKVYFGVGEVNRVLIEKSFYQASMAKKLLAVGLAMHVLKRKKLIEDLQMAKTSEWYAEQVQAMPKSVAETLSRLKSLGYFEKLNAGYRLPNWAMRKALGELDGAVDK